MCTHHWIIEAANGPISMGYCKNCLETKEFRNSELEFDWKHPATRKLTKEEADAKRQDIRTANRTAWEVSGESKSYLN